MKIKTRNVFTAIYLMAILGAPFWVSSVNNIASELKGEILLQTEKNGEAWYVIPNRGERVFLSRPVDALQIMKKYGLGITHNDLLGFKKTGFPERLGGKILLDIEDHGKAYYISPDKLKEHYLGRPTDAFRVMREQGLGVTDQILAKIPKTKNKSGAKEMQTVSEEAREVYYNWKYKEKDFSIKLNLFESIYNYYQNRSKVITYVVGEEPENETEAYFDHYLYTEPAGDIFSELASKIKKEAEVAGLNKSETIELASAFVQSIPYDHELAEDILNNSQDAYMKYPYEVLYEKSGTCGGKSFLAVLLFDSLGYGTALFEFEEDNHLAPGIKCSKEYSTYDSGYCYVEATIKGYPIGIMPESNPTDPSAPEKVALDEGDNVLTQDISGLSKAQIHRPTGGSTYTGIEDNIDKFQFIKRLKEEIEEDKKLLESKRKELKTLKTEIERLKSQLDEYKENQEFDKYNNLLSSYNEKIQEAEVKTEEYNELVNKYNVKINEFNALNVELYQY
jgi:hypothetical protein